MFGVPDRIRSIRMEHNAVLYYTLEIYAFLNESAKHVVALHQSQLRVKQPQLWSRDSFSHHPSAPLQSAGGVQRHRVCHALSYRDTQQRLPTSSSVRLLIWTITVNPCSNKQWPKLTPFNLYTWMDLTKACLHAVPAGQKISFEPSRELVERSKVDINKEWTNVYITLL